MTETENETTGSEDEDPRRPALASIPGIDSAVITVLANARVTLVQHLLAWPEADLARTTGLKRSVLRHACAAVHASYAARCEVASELRASEISRANVRRQVSLSHRVPLLKERSVEALCDAHPGEVIEVVGLPGSGKTQLCLTLAASAIGMGRGVILLDTSSSLCTSRIGSILASCGFSETDTETAFKNLLVVPAATLEKAEEAMEALVQDSMAIKALGPPRKVNTNAAPGDSHGFAAAVLRNVDLIVFDSPAALLAPALGWRWADGWSGFASSNEIASALRELSQLTGATVLTTNRYVKGESEKSLRPALGRSWAHVADTHVFLEEISGLPHDDGCFRTLRRVSSKRSGASEAVVFQLDERGISQTPGPET